MELNQNILLLVEWEVSAGIYCPQAFGQSVPRGWTWHIYKQGSAEYFLGFEFRKFVVFCVLLTAAVFFWVVR